MNRANVGLVIAALLFASACEDRPQRPTRIDLLERSGPGSEPRPDNVSDDVLPIVWSVTDPALRSPLAVYAMGDTLALILDRATPYMHMVNVKRGEYLWPLAKSSGDTAGTFNVFRVAVSPANPHEFVAYDALASTLTTFRIGADGNRFGVTGQQKLASPEAVDWPVWHRDGRISVELVRDSSLRAFVLPDGSITEPSGLALSSLAPEWVPPGVARDAMEGVTCPSPDRTKLARAFTYSGRLMVFDSAGNPLRTQKNEELFEPQYIVHGTGEVVFDTRGNQARVAYRWCGATSTYIFALYSGYPGAASRMSGRAPDPYTRQVHVFDWNGELKGGFFLQRSALALDVTADGRYLIALEASRDPGLIAYEVPKKFRSR